jgi:ATP-dependent DNA helicase RecG
MKNIKLTNEEALYFCNKDEDHFFDKKAHGIKGAKVQKIAVAFANSDGGEIIFGIADDADEPEPAKRWQGRETTEDYNSVIQALSELVPSIDFRFDFLSKEKDLRNYVLRVKINKGLAVHETPDKKVYVRKGAQSLPLTAPIKILELTHAKGIRSEEDSYVNDAFIDDLESSEHLKEFLDNLPISAPEPLNFLLKEQLIHRETWIPKVASLLLFSDNPSAILPKQCAIKIVRYDTSKEDLDRDALTEDRYSIEGHLNQQIIDSFNQIKTVLDKTLVWSLKGLHKASYPDEAIWEVLVNTVIHRDYSISDNVLISIFNNRIEFKSPGRFAGIITPDNILAERFSRNSKIVRLLAKHKDSPNKELGEGMNTTFQRMKGMGLKQPEVVEEGNYVKIIMRHASIKDTEDVIFSFIDSHGEINNRQARDLTGIESSDKITYHFSKLRDTGLIKRRDTTKNSWVAV